jgi:hypothetical protein
MELLAATVLLGVVAGSMCACFISALKLHRRASNLQELEYTIGRISESLSDDLSNLVCVSPVGVLQDSLGITFLTYANQTGFPDQLHSVRTQVEYVLGDEETPASQLTRISTLSDGICDSVVFNLPDSYKISLVARGNQLDGREAADPAENANVENSPSFIDLRVFRSLEKSHDSILVFERIYGVS